MGRYGRVEKIAGVISFLASDAAGYTTGQNLRGRRAAGRVPAFVKIS
jgi:NAD(P)-dependent dehydrogenase (short-subunit alcohol dehydrogenase family)